MMSVAYAFAVGFGATTAVGLVVLGVVVLAKALLLKQTHDEGF